MLFKQHILIINAVVNTENVQKNAFRGMLCITTANAV